MGLELCEVLLFDEEGLTMLLEIEANARGRHRRVLGERVGDDGVQVEELDLRALGEVDEVDGDGDDRAMMAQVLEALGVPRAFLDALPAAEVAKMQRELQREIEAAAGARGVSGAELDAMMQWLAAAGEMGMGLPELMLEAGAGPPRRRRSAGGGGRSRKKSRRKRGGRR